MPRVMPEEMLVDHMVRALLATGENAPSIEEKRDMLARARRDQPENDRLFDAAILKAMGRACDERDGLKTALGEAKESLGKARELLDKLTTPPWHEAVCLGIQQTSHGPMARVLCNGTTLLVGLPEGLAIDQLHVGELVLLGPERNLIIDTASTIPQFGETAWFDRTVDDSRIVARLHDDEELVLHVSRSLQETPLTQGDLIRWRKDCYMALEKLERPASTRFLLSERPDIGAEMVGGQDRNLATLLSALTSVLVRPELAKVYGLGIRSTILMVGPPGCGKTLMARVAASEVGRIKGTSCSFGVVKPSEWESPWVGVTQQNIRACFQALRDASRDGAAVLFLDEVESVGRIRGGAVSHHSDKFLAALLAELDGFQEMNNVAIIAATNRKDLVDPALLERLSGIEITVRRPDLRGARTIFGIHLPPSLPFASNGCCPEATRMEAIETAVSMAYSPNADNAVCTVRLRNGTNRAVTAAELMSGRAIEQMCRCAKTSAFRRELEGDAPGIGVDDLRDAVVEAVSRMRTMLTPVNAHAFLPDLPQDIDVIAVDPVVPRVQAPHRYLSLAIA